MEYFINLALADPAFRGTLKRYAQDLEDAACWFNSRSESSQNPKGLRIVDIQDSLCTVALTSEKALPAPAKALRLFTQYLLAHSDLGEHVYRSCLFRSVRVANQAAPTSNPEEPAEVQVMDKLTRLLVGQAGGKDGYFSVIKTLFDCTADMEDYFLAQFLAKIQARMIAQAQELGHGEALKDMEAD